LKWQNAYAYRWKCFKQATLLRITCALYGYITVFSHYVPTMQHNNEEAYFNIMLEKILKHTISLIQLKCA